MSARPKGEQYFGGLPLSFGSGGEAPAPPPAPVGSLRMTLAATAGTVGIPVNGNTIANTTGSTVDWTLSSSVGIVFTPSNGSTLPNGTSTFSFVTDAAGAYSVTLNATGVALAGSPTIFTSTVVSATTLTLSGPTTGSTGSAATFTITPNGSFGASGTVNITAPGASLSASSISLIAGSNAPLTFTVTRSTDGSSVVSITNTLGLTNLDTPITYTSSAPIVLAAPVYRTNASQMFADVLPSTVTAGDISNPINIPARASVAAPKNDYTTGTGVGIAGPTHAYVEAAAKWAWTNAGGDWINTAGTAQATTLPHFTTSVNAVSSGSASYSAVDCTAGAVAAWTRGRGNAYIVKVVGGSRSIAALHHATAAAPVMTGHYVDGTAFSLSCVACVRLTSGTAYTQIGAAEQLINASVALEFQMPAKAVNDAALAFTLTTHDATPTTLNGYLATPPTNALAVTQGISASYPADSGISAASNVVLAQNFYDGSDLFTWVLPYPLTSSLDYFATSAWDPQVYGGTADTSKLPTAFGGVTIAASGKWFHKQDSSANVTLVSSTYTGDGFVPRAAGVGALRIRIPGNNSSDGSNVGQAGGFGCDLMTLLPLSTIGLATEGHVRFSLMFVWVPKTLAATKMFRSGPGGAADYAVPTGKFGIGFHHLTNGGSGGWSGGSNNDGGENLGWSGRLGYTAKPADIPLGGVNPFWHSQDMRPARQNLSFGKDGGLGASFQPGYWYDIETYLKLNTYNPAGAIGSATADGVCMNWINGRLDATHTGQNWRDGAIDYGRTPNGTYLAPFRNIGFKGLWMNFFNGGLMPPDTDLVWFVGPIVATVG